MAPSPHPIIVLRDAQATTATAAVASVVALAAVGAALVEDWAIVLALAVLLIAALRHLPPTTCRIALDGVEFRWPLRRVRLDARALAVPLRTRPAVSAVRVRPARGLPFVVVLDAWSSPLILRAALAVRFEHAVADGLGNGPHDGAVGPVRERTS